MAGLLVTGLMVARWLGAGVLVAGVLRLGGSWLVAKKIGLPQNFFCKKRISVIPANLKENPLCPSKQMKIKEIPLKINFICDHRNFKGNPSMSVITNEIIGNFP